jgi:hypothetical protein
MKHLTMGRSPALLRALLGGLGLLAGCTDDDPCDPGQIERYGLCYPAPTDGNGGSGGSSASGMAGAEVGGAAESAAGAGAVDTPFGSDCQDETDSSDCGGDAPVCANLTPLGQSVYCTQIDCAEGEEHAGVCPAGFTCFAVSGYPSVCIKG